MADTPRPGQIIAVDGKPQIVEKAEGNLVVSRPATPEELTRRSLPADISPQYNPNITPPPYTPPPEQVKVLHSEPTTEADVRGMADQGYRYVGREGRYEIYDRGKPIVGEVVGKNYKGVVGTDLTPTAPVYEITYITQPAQTTTPATAQTLPPQANPFSTDYIGTPNPFVKDQYLVHYGFSPWEKPPPTDFVGLTAYKVGKGLGYVYETNIPFRALVNIPGGIYSTTETLLTKGVYGYAVETGQGVKYVVGESFRGNFEPLAENIFTIIYLEGMAEYGGKAWARVGEELKGGKITGIKYFVKGVETEKGITFNPETDTSPFVSETSAAVVREIERKNVLGKKSYTYDVVGLGKTKTAGIIKETKIIGKTQTYQFIDTQAAAEVSDITGKAELIRKIEKPGGLQKTTTRVDLQEKAKALTLTGESDIYAKSGTYFIKTDEAFKVQKGILVDQRVRTYSMSDTAGVVKELRLKSGEVNLKGDVLFFKSGGYVEKIRGTRPTLDVSEFRTRPIVPEETITISGEGTIQPRVKPETIYEKPSGFYDETAPIEQAPTKEIADFLPKPYQETIPVKRVIYQKPAIAQGIGGIKSTDLVKGMAASVPKGTFAPVKITAPSGMSEVPPIIRVPEAIGSAVGVSNIQKVGVGETPAVRPDVGEDIGVRLYTPTGTSEMTRLTQGLGLRTYQTEILRTDQTTQQITKTRLDLRRFEIPTPPKPPKIYEPVRPIILIGKKKREPPEKLFKLARPKDKVRFKSGYRKYEELKPSPIQADVSRFYFGKATAPRPTKRLLARATISVPTAEQLRHKTR